MKEEKLKKEMETDYPLIKMGDITDEARMLAVAWCEGYEPMGSINLESKQKLASDIMNYARRNPPSTDAQVLREALEKIDNPIKYLREEAEKDGGKLDGVAAIQLSKDATFLQSIAREALLSTGDGKDRPKIICYCGSIRVALEAFKKAEYDCLMRGDIALLPCCMFVDIEREYGANSQYKVMADEQHKCKIDLCDEVFVLNVGGYIGESTRSEIEYATLIGKPVVYLESLPPKPLNGK